jgi:hypothetical protein
VGKILFDPFSVIGGIIGQKPFEALWGMFDDEEAPDPKHRKIAVKKLVPRSCGS